MQICIYDMYIDMNKMVDEIKRITVNLPSHLLNEAQSYTGKNITETLIEGLEQLRKARAYDLAMSLKGKIKLDIDLEESRERNR